MSYIYKLQWPLQQQQQPSCEVRVAEGGIVTQVTKNTIPFLGQCAGIVFVVHVTNIDEADAQTIRENHMQLCNYFWSSVLQTPFRNCPIGVVVSNKEMQALMPMILKCHHYVQIMPHMDYFEKEEEAIRWFWGQAAKTLSNVSCTFSNIQ